MLKVSIFTLSMIFLGCTGTSSGPAHSPAPAFSESTGTKQTDDQGTVGGGGGGTVGSATLDYGTFRDQLKIARFELILFFTVNRDEYYKRYKINNWKDSLIPRLFQSHEGKNIFTLTNEIKFAEGRCRDADGNEVAGSIHSHVPNTICLNYVKLQSIAEAESRDQILSLIVHEYSHLLGFNETEAESVQTEVYKLLKEFKHQDLKVQFDHLNEGLSKFFYVYNDKSYLTKSWNYLCGRTQDMSKAFTLHHHVSYIEGFSFLTPKQNRYRYLMQRKLDALYLKSCGMADSELNSSLYLSIYENDIFKLKQDIPLSQFVPDFKDEADYDHNLILRYVASPADTEKEFEDIHAFYMKEMRAASDHLSKILNEKSIL